MAMGRPRSFDTDKALDEAMEVFWRHGYDGASLAMLTKAMGIKPPSLYAAFGSKEGLLKAALDRYAERRSTHMRYVLAGATAREVAERFLTSIAESHTDPANPPGCLLVQGGLGEHSVRARLPACPVRDRAARALRRGSARRRPRCVRRPGGVGALSLDGRLGHGRARILGRRPGGPAGCRAGVARRLSGAGRGTLVLPPVGPAVIDCAAETAIARVPADRGVG